MVGCPAAHKSISTSACERHKTCPMVRSGGHLRGCRISSRNQLSICDLESLVSLLRVCAPMPARSMKRRSVWPKIVMFSSCMHLYAYLHLDRRRTIHYASRSALLQQAVVPFSLRQGLRKPDL